MRKFGPKVVGKEEHNFAFLIVNTPIQHYYPCYKLLPSCMFTESGIGVKNRI